MCEVDFLFTVTGYLDDAPIVYIMAKYIQQ